MALNETEARRYCEDARTIEALASALDIGIMIYDRNDTLIAASSQFLDFFDIPPDLLQPGARLRDLFNATFDAGARVLGSLNGKARYISREDWIAERIAIHWRERYESVEKLADGRWVRLCKRRMPDGILISTIQDVTERKRKDEELAEVLKKAELVQVILDNLATPVVVKDSELRYVMVNDAFCRIPALHRKEIVGKKAADLVGPELAARFEKVEGDVLKTGIPYEVLENIHKSDGTVMHAVTRVGRSGTPGNYHVTISFDDVSALAEGEKVSSDYRRVKEPAAAVVRDSAATPAPGEPKGRILVLDADRQRSAERVMVLKEAGYDAVATGSASEAIALLDTAKSLKLDVGKVEVTAELARLMSGQADSGKHALLRQAIEEQIAKESIARSEIASASTFAEASQAPLLSVVASSPLPEATRSAGAAATTPAGSLAGGHNTNAGSTRDRVRILVAEDNDVNQIVFEQILEGIGVDFRIVGNGKEAVTAWSAAAPDLILMDVSMPIMNGLQATQAIRDSEAMDPDRALHVPIIAVTAHAMTGDRERCLAAGMDDYLSKPVSPEKLEAIIQKWVGGSERLLAAG
ncbi:response regulator [Hoeflea alexandrii]|uniref:response regulator n=1 Tax=Hoeflea alexandrii TaxID=288436 RepID=UPI0022B006AD|nr:response regulator [Hoeflea alexandrii]MCZ4290869.1 response regulator [Hoeflea alexandrii]